MVFLPLSLDCKGQSLGNESPKVRQSFAAFDSTGYPTAASDDNRIIK